MNNPLRTVLGAGLTTLLTVGVLTTAAPASHSESPAPGSFHETTLWDAETDPLENYHVHGLAVTPSDTILAFTEGRHETCDAGPRDILLRRSTDRGETWEPSQVVVESVDGQSWGNPTSVVDKQTGEVFLFFGLSLQDEGNTTCSGDRQEIYLVRSADDGQTWTEPVELADLFAGNQYDWTLHGPGPGHGIQLDNGRLLLQVLHRREVVGHSVAERLYGVSMIYSDDHGETWEAADPIPVAVNYPINESRTFQRADGAVVVNGRSAAGGHRQRISSVSTDRGLTWSKPVLEPATDRYTAVDAGFVRFTGPDGVDRVLHSRPDSARRENLTVSVSYDDGYTYRYAKIVNPGSSYYSDLAVLSDGTILMLYGRDGEILSAPQRVALARFDLAWLTNGRDTGESGPGLNEHEFELGTVASTRTRPDSRAPEIERVTPDLSGHRNHAVVTGSPQVVDGPVGSAVALGDADHLEVPLSASLTSAGDTFSAAGWFRTESQSAQTILWSYGMGSRTPQWWIRVEPTDNRIRAVVDTGAGSRSLIAPGAYADNQWHHVALTRSAGTVALYIDGKPLADTDSPVGSTSTDARTGVHIGQRPDGADPLAGAVDEVHLYDRVLTDSEVADLATGERSPGEAVLQLPMQEIQSAPDLSRPAVVTDDNARGGKALAYPARQAGDYAEIPFRLDEPGQFEVAVRHHRTWDRGKVQVSIDGTDLPYGLVDPTLAANEAYQTYQHGTIELGRGLHWIRFTLASAGHLGGTVLAPDHLTLIAAGGPHELVRDVVVDDESVGAFSMAGSWGRATGQPGHPYYGVSYRSAPAGTGDRVVRWQPDVPVTDTFQVLVWYVSHPNRASNAPYTIHHAKGSTTVRVDQRGQAPSLVEDRPGVWVNLGSYPFEAGSAASVELSNDADGFVIADAVTLTRDPVPATPRNIQAVATSPSSIEVSWTASEGATGYHIERRVAGGGAWQFAGMAAADQTRFDSTGLTAATTYEHRVYAIVHTHPGRPARASMASDPQQATTSG